VNLRTVADTLLAALLAPPCALCGRVLERPLDGAVCHLCWQQIQPTAASFALRGISHARALGAYDGTLRDVIHALKYDGRRSIAPRLAQLMTRHGQDVLNGADVVIPVPLHRRRRRQRGFNQAEDLARGLGLPVAPVLRRVRATQPQIELPAEQRRENLRDAFDLRRRGWHTIGGRTDARPLHGSVVVLVDDVATTGATLEACARVLRAAGAEVRALTAARVASATRPSHRA
jgi:ComF family protein